MTSAKFTGKMELKTEYEIDNTELLGLDALRCFSVSKSKENNGKRDLIRRDLQLEG